MKKNYYLVHLHLYLKPQQHKNILKDNILTLYGRVIFIICVIFVTMACVVVRLQWFVQIFVKVTKLVRLIKQMCPSGSTKIQN